MSPCFHLELSHGQARRTVRSQEDALKNREASTFHNFHAFSERLGDASSPAQGRRGRGPGSQGLGHRAEQLSQEGPGGGLGSSPLGAGEVAQWEWSPNPHPGRSTSGLRVSPRCLTTWAALSAVCQRFRYKSIASS